MGQGNGAGGGQGQQHHPPPYNPYPQHPMHMHPMHGKKLSNLWGNFIWKKPGRGLSCRDCGPSERSFHDWHGGGYSWATKFI